jgi:type-F conjugative transfer system pilin assembly protein TrbC
VLRLLIAAGTVACIALAGTASAQPALAVTSGVNDSPASGPDAAPVDGSRATEDPQATARAAIQQAKALANSRTFQAGVDRQRVGVANTAAQPSTHPQFQVDAARPLGPDALTDALSPPARQWATSNRQPLLVLVSFAMPDRELRELATQAARIGAPLVLRGLIDDSFPATQKRLMSFRDIRGAAWRVDPTMFRRFNVGAVPTFILPLEPLQTCSLQTCPAPAHVRVTGDAGLDYVLDEIDRRSADSRAHPLAQALRAQLNTETAP